MSKKLISWVAYNNDFDKGEFNTSGPTANLHMKHLSDYDEHIWLIQKQMVDSPRWARMNEYLTKLEEKEKVVIKEVDLDDIINVNEISHRLRRILDKHKFDEVDAFVSTGTPSMQVSWYFLSKEYNNLKLFQTRKDSSKADIREFIKLEKDKTPALLNLVQESQLKSKEYVQDYLITSSIKPIYDLAKKVAMTDHVSAHIAGESGTGKEHLARFIHEESFRAESPYLAVNCSSFSDDLLRSELFGHKKGAFTGANSDHPGVFLSANGGTVFLDEIGDISPFMQLSLLRVLQERKVQAVGSTTEEEIDVRIITATNRNLRKLCEKGKFRWDLYYRINVAEIEVPNLCSRGRKELKELFEFFVKKLSKEFRKKLKVNKAAMNMILSYPFPGNVRELINLVERLYVYSEEQVDVIDLPDYLKNSNQDKIWSLKHVEAQHVKKALEFFEGNKLKTAEALGIARNTLDKKLQ